MEFHGHLHNVVVHAINDLALVLPVVVQAHVGDDEGGVAVVSLPQEGAVLETPIGLLVEAHGHEHVILLCEVGAVLGPLHPHARGAEVEGGSAVQTAGQSEVASPGCNDARGLGDDRELRNSV